MVEFDTHDGPERQRLAQQQTQDARILGKLNLVHREAFAQKFPGQIEHCMRLVAERLQQGLRKDADLQIGDSSAADLATALLNLWTIHSNLKD